MTERTRARPRAAAAAPPRPSRLLLPVLLAGQFMCIVDVFVVNVAMPSIGAGLRASGAALQLIVGGYTLAYAMLLITGARLGDRYGRRRMYLTGLVAFTVASAACALAPDSQALIAFRFVQGAGAAVMVPQIFSVIQTRFTGQARARALSAYAAVLSAGAVAGLVLGGVIVAANLLGPVINGSAWRPVFGVNVPAGLLLAAAVPRALPADAPPRDDRAGAPGFDLPGLALGVASVLLIVVPLVLGREAGWPAWIYCLLAAGIAAAVAFTAAERRELARGGRPLLNLGVLRAPALPSGLAALAASQVAYGGLLFTFTLFLQADLGLSALRAGLAYLPMSVAFGLASCCWRRLPAAAHRWLPTAGLTLCAAALLAVALAAGDAHGRQLPGLAVAAAAGVGLGLGLCVSPLLARSLARVPALLAADASGLTTTAVQLSQLTGVAVLGSVYFAARRALPLTAGHGMSVTACCLAAVAFAGVPAAVLAMRRDGGSRG